MPALTNAILLKELKAYNTILWSGMDSGAVDLVGKRSKTRIHFGEELQDGERSKTQNSITTDFNELLSLRMKRTSKFQQGTHRFFTLLGIGFVVYILLQLSYFSSII